MIKKLTGLAVLLVTAACSQNKPTDADIANLQKDEASLKLIQMQAQSQAAPYVTEGRAIRQRLCGKIPDAQCNIDYKTKAVTQVAKK